MAKYALGTLFVFILSSIWLIVAISRGNDTHTWTPVEATVVEARAQRSIQRGPKRILTTIEYSFDGIEYKTTLAEILVGSRVTVYVNPEAPTDVVGEQGFQVQVYGRPLIATIGSGLFAVVLLLIAFSPKEE